MRIVSLIASATEIVCALGLQDQLVGRSHECDFPASVKALPQCSRPTFPDGSSREIDRQMRSLVEQSLSIYKIDVELLTQLRPDIILTQDQCEVCAVCLTDVEKALTEFVPAENCKVVSLKPFNLDDVMGDIQRVAEALGVAVRGKSLITELRGRLGQQVVKTMLARRIVCLEWLDPLMACGYWVPQLVQMAGAHDLLGVKGGHAPWLEFAQLLEADPEAIVAIPCGFDLERGCQEMGQLLNKPEWNELRAVRQGNVFVADGNAYFNRPGPRLVESLGVLTGMLWSGHSSGEGWRRLGECKEE